MCGNKILFLNACVRRGSRTKALADALLARLEGEVEEVRLWEENFPKVDEAYILKRDECTARKDFSDEMFQLARQFAAADIIVIAAPFWDLSFPAPLKQYLEQVTVVGLTFHYTERGKPEGLCRAGKIYYVTTTGGPFFPEEYGYGYVKALADRFYGIRDTELIAAVGLDLEGADAESIIKETIKSTF